MTDPEMRTLLAVSSDARRRANPRSRSPDVNGEPRQNVVVASDQQGSRFTCTCGNVLRTFGKGRHQIYFPLADNTLTSPITTRACPDCGRQLPGKNRPA
jgi:hypothetical protein